MKNALYRRLPGRRWVSMSGQTSLWIGSDHVLAVQSTGFTESYRRFYLRDIAAIVVQRNNRWMIWNLVLGATLGFGGLLATALVLGNSDEAIAFGRFLFAFLLAPIFWVFVIHLVRGRTCTVRIQTAVQSAEIPSVGRMRAAEKLLAQLTPLIQLAQPMTPPPSPESAPAPSPENAPAP